MNNLDELINSTVDELDRDEAIIQLRDLRKIISDLRVVESLLVSRVASLMKDEQRLAVPGVGVVERKSGTQRKAWDHDRILSLVASRAADDAYDKETGSIPPLGVVAQHVAEAVARAAGISYWKVTVLKELGISANDFCDVTYGLPSILIRES